MDRIKQLQALSDAATAYVVEKYGSTSMKCVEGRHHLFTAARKEGLKEVRKAQGFYFGRHHNWVFDPVTDTIIDPTASQFGAKNGVVMPGTLQHRCYDEVPKEYVHQLGMQESLQHGRWQVAKKWLNAGTTPEEQWGENKVEWRTSKRGDDYLYFQLTVHFDKYATEQLRSGLVFRTKDGGFHLSLAYQRRVLVDGKVYRPVRIKHFLVTPHGALLESVRGKWQPYRDDYSHMYATPEDFLYGSTFPNEVQELVLEEAA